MTSKGIILLRAYEEIMEHIKLSRDVLKFTSPDGIPKNKWYDMGKELTTLYGKECLSVITFKIYDTVKRLMYINDPFYIEVLDGLTNLDVCWDDFFCEIIETLNSVLM